MPPEPTMYGSLPPNVQDDIDEVCQQFQQAFETVSAPRIESFLARIEDRYAAILLRELLTIEITGRFARGDVPVAEEYGLRFPEHRQHVEELLSPPVLILPRSTVSAAVQSNPTRESAPVLADYTFSGRQLGEGGMGVVWRARDERLHRAEIERATAEAESRRAAAEAREERVRATARSERRARHLAWGLAAALAFGLVGTSCFFVAAKRQAIKAETERGKAVMLGNNLRRLEYSHQIGLSLAEWDADNARNAWDYLESTNIDFRGWEYRYLRHLFERDDLTIQDQGIEIRSVSFHPDGKCVAGPAGNHTVKIWDAHTGHLIRSLPCAVEVMYVAFSPNGKLLAAGGAEWFDRTAGLNRHCRGEVKVWNAETFDEIRTFKMPAEEIWSVAFDAESKVLAAGGGRWDDSTPGKIRMWETSSWQEMKPIQGHEKWITGVAFGPAGRLASASGDGTVRIWDFESGGQVGAPLKPDPEADESNAVIADNAATRVVRNIAFSPDGKLLAAACWDGKARIWDLATRRLCYTLEGHKNCIHSVAFRPDGMWLASASWDGTVKLWDVSNGKELRTLKGQRGWVLGVAFSPDGRCLVTGGKDSAVRFWNLTEIVDGSILKGHTEEVVEVAFHPNGRLLVSVSPDGTVRVWDSVKGKVVRILRDKEHAFACAAFTPDGRHLAAGIDQTVAIWELATWKSRRLPAKHMGIVTCLAISPDGKHLCTGGQDQKVMIWDLSTGCVTHILSQHAAAVTGVAFSPDNRHLATCSLDKVVIIWDRNTGQWVHRLEGHQDAVNDVAYNRDGSRLVSTSEEDFTVRIWDVSTGQVTRKVDVHNGVLAVCFGADDRRLFTADNDCKITLWDVEDESVQNVVILRGHTGRPTCLSLTPDGTRLASGGWDKTIRIWEAPLWRSP